MRMAEIEPPLGLKDLLARGVGRMDGERQTYVPIVTLGHMGLQRQALELSSAAVLLPLRFMQGQPPGLFAQEPLLQGPKLSTDPNHILANGRLEQFLLQDKRHSTHRQPLDCEEPASIELFCGGAG
jgi:hypothetical protein